MGEAIATRHKNNVLSMLAVHEELLSLFLGNGAAHLAFQSGSMRHHCRSRLSSEFSDVIPIRPASCTNDLRTLFLLVLQFLSWPRLLRKPVARKCWASLFCYPYQPPLLHDHTPILGPISRVGNLFLHASHGILLLHSVHGSIPR